MKLRVEIDSSIHDKAILAVVSAFVGAEISAKDKVGEWNFRMHDNKPIEFGLDIIATEELLDKGFRDLLVGILSYPFRLVSDVALLGDADYTIDQVITHEKIIKIATPSKRAYAQVVGLLIGAEASSLVDISKLVQLQQNPRTILLVLPADELILYKQVLELFQEFAQKQNYTVMLIDEYNLKFTYRLDLLADKMLVVGPPSFCTYAAACLAIPCIEIVSSFQDIELLSKWSSKKYGVVIHKDLVHLTPNRIRLILEKWRNDPAIVMTQQEMLNSNEDGVA